MKKINFLLGISFICLIAVSYSSCVNQQHEKDGLTIYKNYAKTKLTAYVEGLNKSDYSNENWEEIIKNKNTGERNISVSVNKTEVNAALNTALKDIHMVDYKGRDFILIILVEETTVRYGKDFIVNVCLRNRSGVDVEIFYLHSPFNAHIANWSDISFPPLDMPLQPDVLTIENGESFHETRHLRSMGYCDPSAETWTPIPLPLGNHELKFRVIIQQEVEVWSNPVLLTVY